MRRIVIYDCDPDENQGCSKEGCYRRGGNCYCTSDANAARRDEFGRLKIMNIIDEDKEKKEAKLYA